MWYEYSLRGLRVEDLKMVVQWSSQEKRSIRNVLRFAKLYPIWYARKLNRLSLYRDREKKRFIVKMPKLRAFRRSYYSWLKYVEFPKNLRWVLVTLTLKRDISLQTAWCNINHWTSAFLIRLRDYVRKVAGSHLSYFWVVEPHNDDYPHVHLVCSFPFIPLEKIISWWIDDDGNPLSEPQGVDVRFIGSIENVKNYLLKYLVKRHHKYWSFYQNGDRVRVRLATLFMWFYRVRLYGMSRDIKRPVFTRSYSGRLEFLGSVNPFFVWCEWHRYFGIPLDAVVESLMEVGVFERSYG